jgi:hypothetical protein
MKIPVFAKPFIMGGTQVNAIDVALRDIYLRDVEFFAVAGPMVKVAMERGIRFISAP